MADPTYLLELELDRALVHRGVSLDALRQYAVAIALFGSRAGGCARPSSDWDLLCVGKGGVRRLPGMDLVCIEPRDLEAPNWLGGDLAGHIAAHGVWVHGAPPWRLDDVCFARAARRKEERIARRIRSMDDIWGLWRMPYRQKHAVRLRRDVQRLEILMEGMPIPPTATLDQAWLAEPQCRQRFEPTLCTLGAPPDFAWEVVEAASGL